MVLTVSRIGAELVFAVRTFDQHKSRYDQRTEIGDEGHQREPPGFILIMEAPNLEGQLGNGDEQETEYRQGKEQFAFICARSEARCRF